MSEPTTENERGIKGAVNSMAGLLAHGGGVLSAGDMAALRRMDPRHIDAPGFYKLLSAIEQRLPGGEEARARAETRWAAVIVALAHLGELHRPGRWLGQALVEAGFSEPRFVRLLRADEERLLDELPALARFLAAKGVAADFADAARLLLDRQHAEEVRRSLARSYYGMFASKHDSKTTQKEDAS